MKKLAIMFVMLLGSVATMQAQSFDFACETIDNGGSVIESDFTAEDVTRLTDAGFIVDMELPAFGDTYSQTVDAIEYFIFYSMEYNDQGVQVPTYTLGYIKNGEDIRDSHLSLEAAVVAYHALFDTPNGG